MDNQRSDFEDVRPIWERLRERLEQMRAAQGRNNDPEARARKLADRARLMRRQAGTAEQASMPLYFLAFTKGRERYGIPLEQVLEVQALEQYSPVPGAPVFVRGVVHWRGAILALLDLTRLFEVAETGLSDLHSYVVVEAAGRRLAVAASVTEDIMEVPRDRLQIAPQLPPRIAPEWVLGIHDDNRLVVHMVKIIEHLDQNSQR